MRLFAIIFICSCFTACEFKVETKHEKEPPKKAVESYKRNTDKVRNGIKLTTKGGVRVEQAYLTYSDDGTLVDEQNITAVNREMRLNLKMDGWKPEDGQVFIEAAEKVTTSDGKIVLDEPALFKAASMESVSEAAAKEVYLDVVIRKVYTLSDYFLVEFRVWNKKDGQAVEGSYKFYLDNM